MNALRIGSLCTGYGGLDVAVQAVIGGEHAWMAENDPHATKVLAHHWPAVPNLGDVTVVDWAEVEPVEIVAAGFPCTNISNAGNQEGIDGKESRIWKNVFGAVRALRPGLVVLENVAALRTRGLGVVVADLASIGYDAVWVCIRASDACDAPHGRDRWFCLAYPAVPHAERRGWDRWAWSLAEAYKRDEPADRGRADTSGGVALLSTPCVADARGTRNFTANRRAGAKFSAGKTLTDVAWLLEGGPSRWVSIDGIDYGPAIHRWEAILGRVAPEPAEPGARGGRRLTAPFVEWLMGLPPGHVTAVPGIPDRHQIRVLGGGVVPRHGIAGIEMCLSMLAELERRAAA